MLKEATNLEKNNPESINDQQKRLNLTEDRLLDMYKTMCKIRRFERMADTLYAMGKVHGTMHLSAGQEAAAVGSGFAIRRMITY